MNPAPLQVSTVFASPIVTARLPQAGTLNRELRTLFLAREAEGDRYRKSDRTPTEQVNIFESSFDLFSWPDAPIQKLRTFCLDALSRTVMQLNDFSPEQLKRLATVKLEVDCWFHITRFGGYIGNHTHPMASWSGVYCVCPGETPAAYPHSGLLRFPDARPCANMYVDPGNVRMRAPYDFGGVNYRLEAGLLLLFPSYLAHEATAFFGRDERITVAFNCSFSMPAGGGAFGY